MSVESQLWRFSTLLKSGGSVNVQCDASREDSQSANWFSCSATCCCSGGGQWWLQWDAETCPGKLIAQEVMDSDACGHHGTPVCTEGEQEVTTETGNSWLSLWSCKEQNLFFSLFHCSLMSVMTSSFLWRCLFVFHCKNSRLIYWWCLWRGQVTKNSLIEVFVDLHNPLRLRTEVISAQIWCVCCALRPFEPSSPVWVCRYIQSTQGPSHSDTRR